MAAALKPTGTQRPAAPLGRRASPLNLQRHPYRPERSAMPLAGDGGVSLLFHAAVITAVLYATQSVRHAGTPGAFGTAGVAIALPEQRYSAPTLDVPLHDVQTVIVPAVIPTAIPPVDLQEHFDLKDFVDMSSERGMATGVAPVADQPYDPNLVDDPPILLSSPLLGPALPPQAGHTSGVVVQAVIDTAGRAEAGSVRVIQSADTAFDHHAQQWMLEAVWRPARVAGRPVRLRVNRAIDYTITRFR